MHMFHFQVGESSVTLQGVAFLLGLRVAGQTFVSPVMEDMRATCHELLCLCVMLGHLRRSVCDFGGSATIP